MTYHEKAQSAEWRLRHAAYNKANYHKRMSDPTFRAKRRSRSEAWNQSPEGKVYMQEWTTRNAVSKAKRDSLYHKARFKKLKQEVLAAYGNRCVCCDVTEPAFLTLDHIGGGGKEHRKRVSNGIYLDLKRRGFPKQGLRILCMNCNFAIRFGADCPHQTKILKAA